MGFDLIFNHNEFWCSNTVNVCCMMYAFNPPTQFTCIQQTLKNISQLSINNNFKQQQQRYINEDYSIFFFLYSKRMFSKLLTMIILLNGLSFSFTNFAFKNTTIKPKLYRRMWLTIFVSKSTTVSYLQTIINIKKLSLGLKLWFYFPFWLLGEKLFNIKILL